MSKGAADRARAEVERLNLSDRVALDTLAGSIFGSDWSVGSAERFLRRPECLAVGVRAGSILQAYLLTLGASEDLDVISVAVAEGFRGHGLAKKLFQHLFDQDETKRVFLEVEVYNVAAIGLYRALGFEHISTRLRYYRGVRDAWVFRWEKKG